MRDLLILLHYGALTGQTVYLMTDDFKDYFNQHKLRPSEYWKSVMITLAVPGDPWYDESTERLAFNVEMQHGFGFKHASNLAQRHSNFLMDELEADARVVNRQILESHRAPAGRRWLARRMRLREKTGRVEDRTITARCYTDDVFLQSVGVEATVALCKAWAAIVAGTGLRMADAVKRQLGVAVVWLGVYIFSTLGLVCA
jgi:hypothetical protein